MKSILACLATIAGLVAYPVLGMAAADNKKCQATIRLTLTGQYYQSVSANFKSTNDNYALTVMSGKSKTKKVNCGNYDIAATPVMKATQAAAQGVVGQCKLSAGPQVLDNGNSIAVTFPNDFNCH